jgi:5-methylcytosine-specific restriction endonuclease McrA
MARVTDKIRKVGSFQRKKRKLFKTSNYTCTICGFSIKEQIEELDKIEKPKNRKNLKEYYNSRSLILSQIQVHHKVPLSKGGKNTSENLVICCSTCHENIHKLEEQQKRILELNNNSNKAFFQCFFCQNFFMKRVSSSRRKNNKNFFCSKKCYQLFKSFMKKNDIILINERNVGR